MGNILLTNSLELTTEQEAIKNVVEHPNIIKEYILDFLPTLFSFGIRLVVALVVFFAGRRLLRFVLKIFKKSLERGNVESGVITFLCSMGKYVMYFLLVMLTLSCLGISAISSTIVAVLGSAGITAGLALQGSLSNFIGGVLILILKPFVVGDYIITHVENQEGTVSAITIFYTKLKTIDNKVVLLPNGELSNSTITNVSKMDYRRIDLIIGVSYSANLSETKRVLETVVMNQDNVLKNDEEHPINIFVSDLGDSSVNMGVRVWVNNDDYWPAKWKLIEDIKNALDDNGIDIPFPQMDIHMNN